MLPLTTYLREDITIVHGSEVLLVFGQSVYQLTGRLRGKGGSRAKGARIRRLEKWKIPFCLGHAKPFSARATVTP